LAFSSGSGARWLHAMFILSVGGFVCCSIWILARSLSPLPSADDPPTKQDRDAEHCSDEPMAEKR
jgi:hypothetical protein